MNGLILKYISKFFVQQWILGVARSDINSIIRNKIFDPHISWREVKSADKFQADPFLYKANEGEYILFFEDFSYTTGYGKIAAAIFNEDLDITESKILLDTKSHLSYPFIYSENGKVYLLPEASSSGKLTCYEYDVKKKSLCFLKDLINLPLLDSTIIKHNDKYWLFATINGHHADNELHIYYSDSLLGEYKAHRGNPVRTGLKGSRPAGNIIETDGKLFRPAQSSMFTYGDSIIINKIKVLSESEYSEEFYMNISINRKNKCNRGLHNLHTINCVGNFLVVDGTRWRFSPGIKLRQFSQKYLLRKS